VLVVRITSEKALQQPPIADLPRKLPEAIA